MDIRARAILDHLKFERLNPIHQFGYVHGHDHERCHDRVNPVDRDGLLGQEGMEHFRLVGLLVQNIPGAFIHFRPEGQFGLLGGLISGACHFLFLHHVIILVVGRMYQI